MIKLWSELPGARSKELIADIATIIWVVFWGMHRHSPEIQRVHAQAYGGYLALVHELLQAAHAQGDRLPLGSRLAAIGLTALLDGLWLEWCLNPRAFAPDEAIALCESWIRRER